MAPRILWVSSLQSAQDTITVLKGAIRRSVVFTEQTIPEMSVLYPSAISTGLTSGGLKA
jgi:hypothetical protein